MKNEKWKRRPSGSEKSGMGVGDQGNGHFL